MADERDVYWDIVKGIGISVIVLAHSGWTNNVVMQDVSYFDLALFFFVSGYLFKEKYSSDPYTYIGRKIRNLWWPYMQYVVVFILLHNVFLKLNIYSSLVGIPGIITTLPYTFLGTVASLSTALLQTAQSELMAGAMWFIMPLFVIMSIFSVIKNISYRLPLPSILKELLVLFLVVFVSGLGVLHLKRSITLPWRTDVAFYAAPIVYLGYLARKYWNKAIFHISFVVLAVLLFIFCFKQNAYIAYFPGGIGKWPLTYLASISGIYIVLYMAKQISKISFLAKGISYLGKSSFHIMALHFLSFKIVNLIDVLVHHKPMYNIAQFAISNTSWWPIYLVAGLCVPAFCVYLYRQIHTSLINKTKNNAS
jgi:fucose 4-O-acetylase-like acetyltransferase